MVMSLETIVGAIQFFQSFRLMTLKKQIIDTEDALTKVLGSSSKLMRPPYGAITDDIRNSLDLSFIYVGCGQSGLEE